MLEMKKIKMLAKQKERADALQKARAEVAGASAVHRCRRRRRNGTPARHHAAASLAVHAHGTRSTHVRS